MKNGINYLILATTLALAAFAHFFATSMPVWLSFALLCIGIVVAAGFLGKATESVAHFAGERIGGFLNATFGNAAELIIAFFLVKEGMFEMVKASITGSIIGNMLLVLGLSVFIGGLRHRVQRFNVQVASHNSSLMLLAIIAMLVPASLSKYLSAESNQTFSLVIATALMIAYVLWLFFSMVTHKSHFVAEEIAKEPSPSNNVETDEDEELPPWSKWGSIIALSVATIIVAFESEWLVHSLEPVAELWGLSDLFLGAFLIAIIGNAAEHSAAILMAWKNKIGASVEISVGSSLQIALFVSPLLVWISYFLGNPMDMVFSTPELIAIAVSIFIAKSISQDGETNWYEGVLLLVVYAILGFAFYWITF